MSETRIIELEAELLVATDMVAQLTKTNAELTVELADATHQLKKAKRNSRSDASSFQSQLNVLQNRRG